MAGSSGRHDFDVAEGAEFLLADFHLVQKHLAGFEREPAQGGVANGARLFVDFLDGEVLEAAFFGQDGIPGDVLNAARDGVAVKAAQLHAVGREHGQVAVRQKEKIAGVIEDGGNVAGHKIFVLAQADHHRRSLAHGDDLVGIAGGNDGQGKDAAQLAHGGAHGFLEVVRFGGRPLPPPPSRCFSTR